jgi:hypothetical protein
MSSNPSLLLDSHQEVGIDAPVLWQREVHPKEDNATPQAFSAANTRQVRGMRLAPNGGMKADCIYWT